MNIGIVGNGGREHSICEQIFKSNNVNNIYCFPGNAGTSIIAKNINLEVNQENEFELLKDFCFKTNIHILIIGPEKPLVNGIVDYFANTNTMIFGPNKIASQLEGSKVFTKMLCKKHNIPTANCIVRTVQNIQEYISQNTEFPIVIKVDGLAAGKGVYVCNSVVDSQNAVEDIVSGKCGYHENILVEEFLKGEEMSFFIISDGNTYKYFCTAQDYKRALNGNKGKNTGGMGCYSPSKLIDSSLEEKIFKQIIDPTIKALDTDYSSNYIGFLYAGLMISTNGDPFLVEYNVRMGDPECQTILPNLETDFLDLIYKCCTKNLSSCSLKFRDTKSVCTVLCANGYPDEYKKGIEINTSKVKLKNNQFIYHAGTKITDQGTIVSNGGRVMNIVSTTDSYNKSRTEVLEILYNIAWIDGYYRTDIGLSKNA